MAEVIETICSYCSEPVALEDAKTCEREKGSLRDYCLDHARPDDHECAEPPSEPAEPEKD